MRLNSQSATASGSSGAPNSYLTAVSASASGNSSKWQLVPYLGEDREATNFSSSAPWTNSGVEIDSHEEVFYYSYSTRIGYNHINVAIGSQYTDMADVSWNENTCIMTYTAKEIGQAITYSHISDGSDSEPIYEGYRYWRNIPTEGTYYIQNVHSSQYIDIEGPSTTEGADLQQWAFSTAVQKRWIAEKVENSGGYVRFKSVYSGLYMGVNSGNTSLIEQYAAQNDYTLWKLDRTSKGNIKFICKATESSGKVLAPLNNGTSNGIDLSQATYVDDDNYLDEWFIIKKVISYVNYFDSTLVGNTVWLDNIETANEFANYVFSKYYNLGTIMDGAATQHSTRIDSCPLGPNAQCSNEICGTNCYVQHHKNALAISDELYNSPREDDHIYVLWTDHPAGTYCSGSSSTHTSRDWIAVVMNNRPVINFMNICGADADNELACMALNLIHETAHCLYMYEAYNRPNHTRELVPFCVMNRFSLQTSYAFYLDVIYGDKQPFCDSCDEAMKNYTSNVVIEGNT